MEPPSPHDAGVQAAWAAHRRYLLAVAAGMLKRQDDAEDVVQEAFARLAASPHAIEDVRGWLVVVTRRLCLDRLDRAESRRTTATAEPPEPREAPGGIADPAEQMMLHDEVCQAFRSWSTGSPRRSGPRSSSTTSSASPSTRWPGSSGAPRRRAGSWPAALACRSGPARIPPGSRGHGLGVPRQSAWRSASSRSVRGGDVHGLIALLDPEVAGFRVVIGLPPCLLFAAPRPSPGGSCTASASPLAFPCGSSTLRGGLRWSSAGVRRSWRWSAWMTVRPDLPPAHRRAPVPGPLSHTCCHIPGRCPVVA